MTPRLRFGRGRRLDRRRVGQVAQQTGLGDRQVESASDAAPLLVEQTLDLAADVREIRGRPGRGTALAASAVSSQAEWKICRARW